MVPGDSQATDILYTALGNGGVAYYQGELPGTFTNTASNPCPSANTTAVFASTKDKILYAGCSTGTVGYSQDNGAHWTPYSSSPDGSAIVNIFVTNDRVYVNTTDEYAYTNPVLTGGVGAWTVYGQTVFSLFANTTGSVVDSGTQGGYIFSLLTGNERGYITNSPINSIFVQ